MCAPCRQFAEACGQALNVNERLIKEDQLEYQEEMRAHYRDMLTELSGVMNEQVRLPGNQAMNKGGRWVSSSSEAENMSCYQRMMTSSS